jgi:hypothetical protein
MTISLDRLYEEDFYQWTQHQARALQRLASGRLSEPLDIPHLVEEVRASGKSERDAVRSQITRILEHALKLAFSPAQAPRAGWTLTIDDAAASCTSSSPPACAATPPRVSPTSTPTPAAGSPAPSPATASRRPRRRCRRRAPGSSPRSWTKPGCRETRAHKPVPVPLPRRGTSPRPPVQRVGWRPARGSEAGLWHEPAMCTLCFDHTHWTATHANEHRAGRASCP